MDTCAECGGKFPAAILIPMVTSEGQTGLLCGICALKIRNMIHGMSPDTPFQGEVAQWMYEEAVKIKSSRKA